MDVLAAPPPGFASTIAVSKGQLFLRTEKNLYAIAR